MTRSVLWWILICGLTVTWFFTLELTVTGMDAGYYFQAARDLMAGRNAYSSGDFLYPPVFGWVLVPGHKLFSPSVQTVIFNLINSLAVIALLAGSFIICGLRPGIRHSPDRWLIPIISGFILFSPVTWTATGLGNISPIIGALCVWAGVFYKKGHYKKAAILTTLATLIKIIPLLLLVFMFFRAVSRKNRRMLMAATGGAFLVLGGLLPIPGLTDFIHGAGGTTKWGIDIGGAAVSIHVWMSRITENPALNHPEIALLIFAASCVGAALYGIYSNRVDTFAWITIMVLADLVAPKNCPHLYLSMCLPIFVMFSRHTAISFAVDTNVAAQVPATRGQTGSGAFFGWRLSNDTPGTSKITKTGGVIFALSLPWLLSRSEYFYLRGSNFGELLLPVIPIILVILQTAILGRWNREYRKR